MLALRLSDSEVKTSILAINAQTRAVHYTARVCSLQAASLRDGGVLLFVCMSVCGGGCLSCRSLCVIVFVVIYCCRGLRQV